MFLVLIHIDQDECESFPCLHNGTCQNFEGGHRCTCKEGWTGENCNKGELGAIELNAKLRKFLGYLFLLYIELAHPHTLTSDCWADISNLAYRYFFSDDLDLDLLTFISFDFIVVKSTLKELLVIIKWQVAQAAINA